MRNTLKIIAIAAVAGLGSVGCGGTSGSDMPELVQVTGQLLAEGKPVSGAEVRFQPVAGSGGLSEATTDEEGKFELNYNSDKQGAVVGTHKVKVTVYGERGPSPGDGLPGPPLKPPKEYDLGSQEVKPEGPPISLEIPAK